MNIVDYLKIEEIKSIIVIQLRMLGLNEQAKTINEKDLDLMINVMSQIGAELREKETEDERLDFLIAYIVGLLGRLIIDYGAKLEEL